MIGLAEIECAYTAFIPIQLKIHTKKLFALSKIKLNRNELSFQQ